MEGGIIGFQDLEMLFLGDGMFALQTHWCYFFSTFHCVLVMLGSVSCRGLASEGARPPQIKILGGGGKFLPATTSYEPKRVFRVKPIKSATRADPTEPTR